MPNNWIDVRDGLPMFLPQKFGSDDTGYWKESEKVLVLTKHGGVHVMCRYEDDVLRTVPYWMDALGTLYTTIIYWRELPALPAGWKERANED